MNNIKKKLKLKESLIKLFRQSNISKYKKKQNLILYIFRKKIICSSFKTGFSKKKSYK